MRVMSIGERQKKLVFEKGKRKKYDPLGGEAVPTFLMFITKYFLCLRIP